MSAQKAPPDKLVIDYYNSDLSLTATATAKHFGVSKTTILKILKRNGVTIRKPNYKRTPKKISISKEQLYDLYIKQNYSAAKIAVMFGCNAYTIERKLKHNNISKSNHMLKATISTPDTYCWDNEEWLRNHYVHLQKSLSQIAKEVNSTPETIKNRLLKHNIAIRTHKEAAKIAANTASGREQRRKIALKLWNNHTTRDTIIAKLKAVHPTISATHRKNISTAMKRLYGDDKYRQKHKERMARLWQNPTPAMLANLHNIIAAMQDHSSSILELIVRETLDDFGIPYRKICSNGYEFDLCIEAEDINQRKGVLIEINEFRDHDKFLFWQNKLSDKYQFEVIWEYEFGAHMSLFSRLSTILPLHKREDIKFEEIMIKPIAKSEATKLYGKYHYLGRIRQGYHLGAFINEKIISACSFSPITRVESAERLKVKPDAVRELSRFCISPLVSRKNLASYLLTRYVKHYLKYRPQTKILITFADPFVGHKGTLYKACGWKHDGMTSSSYFYVKNKHHYHKKTVYGYARSLGMTETEFINTYGFERIKTPPKHRYLFIASQKG